MNMSKKNVDEIIKRIAIAQDSAYVPVCPRCGERNMRRTNESKTVGERSRRTDLYICSNCAMEEAAEDYYEDMQTVKLSEWALFTGADGMGETHELYADPSEPVSTNGMICVDGSFGRLIFFGLHLKGSTKCDGQQFLKSVQAGSRNLKTEDIYLVRDANCTQDKNAIELWCRSDGEEIKLGFIARTQNPIVANCIDNGGSVRIVKYTIYGRADSFCGLFMDAVMEFPTPTQR